ncbi:hypothetical protein [Amycolatopsis orientalis]|uniref:hypothetical protein n=1 Tax=Amycolatopsis orientalis TaxID=31958 RepID=UPI001268EADC|nr:hypothetical protein [Amycolatopsis orientalis]
MRARPWATGYGGNTRTTEPGARSIGGPAPGRPGLRRQDMDIAVLRVAFPERAGGGVSRVRA